MLLGSWGRLWVPDTAQRKERSRAGGAGLQHFLSQQPQEAVQDAPRAPCHGQAASGSSRCQLEPEQSQNPSQINHRTCQAGLRYLLMKYPGSSSPPDSLWDVSPFFLPFLSWCLDTEASPDGCHGRAVCPVFAILHPSQVSRGWDSSSPAQEGSQSGVWGQEWELLSSCVHTDSLGACQRQHRQRRAAPAVIEQLLKGGGTASNPGRDGSRGFSCPAGSLTGWAMLGLTLSAGWSPAQGSAAGDGSDSQGAWSTRSAPTAAAPPWNLGHVLNKTAQKTAWEGRGAGAGCACFGAEPPLPMLSQGGKGRGGSLRGDFRCWGGTGQHWGHHGQDQHGPTGQILKQGKSAPFQ